MGRKIGTEVEVVRNASEKWEVIFQAAEDGITEQEHIRCKHMGPFYAPLVRFCGEWPADIQNDPALAPVRAAAERIWWERKTPGKDEFRDKDGDLWQFRNATFSCVDRRYFGSSFNPWLTATLSRIKHYDDDEINRASLAWHRANYMLADDEHYGPDGPAKMLDDQVRDGAGRLENMSLLPQLNDVAFDNYCSLLTLNDVPAGVASNHPAHIPGQRARIEAFLARNMKATTEEPECYIEDLAGDTLRLRIQTIRGNVTVATRGARLSVLLTPSDLRKLAETATKIADRIEGKSVGRPVPVE